MSTRGGLGLLQNVPNAENASILFSVVILWVVAIILAQDRPCYRSTKCSGPLKASFDGPWSSNILAPPLRVVWPKQVLNSAGNVTGNYYPLRTVLRGNGSSVIFDFGQEVGGLLTLDYGAQGKATVGMAFSEAKTWIGEYSDSSSGRKGEQTDGYLYDIANETAYWNRYTMPPSLLRGGFRYLTLFLKDTPNPETAVAIYNVQVEISFQPTWSDLRAYQGYFHSSDEVLNKLWYSGAYTLQTNTIPTVTGRPVPAVKALWENNARVGYGESILVDGAKRDRAVWAGDLGVTISSVFVSTGDLESVRNALSVVFMYQQKNGSLPEAGPPVWHKHNDAYHLWTLIGMYNYILYTDDMAFLRTIWDRYTKAVEYILIKGGNQGELNAEESMLLHRALVCASKLAIWMNGEGDTLLSTTYLDRVKSLRRDINSRLFDKVAGAYRDRVSRPTLFPQSANSLAISFDIADLATRLIVSRSLTNNWTPYGPHAPELPGNISPYLTSLELHAHFSVGETFRGLDLLRRTWSWYLTHPNGTQSTMIEGFRVDGTFNYRTSSTNKNNSFENDAAYVSHSHGWSTGPTSALTMYIAGLDVTAPGGRNWTFAPQFGSLSFAEAGFTTTLGKFRSRWALNYISPAQPVTNGYNVTLEAPGGTIGDIHLPLLKSTAVLVTVNNKTMNRVDEDGLSVLLTLFGGTYDITVRSADIAAHLGEQAIVPAPGNDADGPWWPLWKT